MRIVAAPDSYKGSLSALEIVDLLAKAAAEVFEDVETIGLPVADGGEGTVDSLLYTMGGEKYSARVTGPLGDPVTAHVGILKGGRTAVMEMAQASGLSLLSHDRLDPLRATSRGMGELLLAALDSGVKEILIGIGGSATNDGGVGFLRALGARFRDADGKETPEGGGFLHLIRKADFSGLDPRLKRVGIRVICDVSNPLLGETGATYIYGPQKGVSAGLCLILDEGMGNFAQVVEDALGISFRDAAGAGAAGGMGFALGGVLGAALMRGVDAVLDIADFEKLVRGADLVVTAEGRMDRQSIEFGKVPVGVAARCHQYKIPVVAIVGGMTKDAMAFCGENASLMTTVNDIMSLEEALKMAAELFYDAAVRMFRMIRIGGSIRGGV